MKDGISCCSVQHKRLFGRVYHEYHRTIQYQTWLTVGSFGNGSQDHLGHTGVLFSGYNNSAIAYMDNCSSWLRYWTSTYWMRLQWQEILQHECCSTPDTAVKFGLQCEFLLTQRLRNSAGQAKYISASGPKLYHTGQHEVCRVMRTFLSNHGLKYGLNSDAQGDNRGIPTVSLQQQQQRGMIYR